MLLNFDLHVHSWFSPDALDPPEELIAAARRAGLHGIAITDHDDSRAHSHLRSLGLASPDGRPVNDFLVLPGVEISTAQGHLLLIGATPPPMPGAPAADAVALALQLNAVPIPAHPFDHWRSGIPPETLDQLPLTTLETFNAAVSSPAFNHRAAHYAARRRLAATAASDAHHSAAVGTAFISLELPELSLPAVLDALRNPAAISRTERYLSFRQALRKHFANWFRLLRRRRPPPAPHPHPVS